MEPFALLFAAVAVGIFMLGVWVMARGEHPPTPPRIDPLQEVLSAVYILRNNTPQLREMEMEYRLRLNRVIRDLEEVLVALREPAAQEPRQ